MALGAIFSGLGSVLNFFKEDPAVAVAKEQARAQKHISDNQLRMNNDNNDTTLELGAMNYERSDISESRWMNFTSDTMSAPMSCHVPYCSGYFPIF